MLVQSNFTVLYLCFLRIKLKQHNLKIHRNGTKVLKVYFHNVFARSRRSSTNVWKKIWYNDIYSFTTLCPKTYIDDRFGGLWTRQYFLHEKKQIIDLCSFCNLTRTNIFLWMSSSMSSTSSRSMSTSSDASLCIW